MKNIAIPTFSNETDSIERLTGSVNQFLENVLPPEGRDSISRKILGSEIYKHFITLWLHEAGRSKKAGMQMHSLYGGFFCQEAAKYCDEIEEKKELLLTALRYYETFQGGETFEDINYYVQWQLSLVKELLGHPWPEIETSLAYASNFNPSRGEAMKHIIQHYRQTKEYGIAYMYSSVALNNHLNKYSLSMKWFVDPAYYNWKILNYHASICAKIGNGEEAEETFKCLFDYSQQHPNEFTEEQMQSIFQNQKVHQA